MNPLQAFEHLAAQTVSIPATTTSASVNFTAVAVLAIASGQRPQMQIYNAGTVAIFIRTSAGPSTALVPNGATPGDYPVAPGAVVVVTLGGNPDTVSAICASGTATVYCTPGCGL